MTTYVHNSAGLAVLAAAMAIALAACSAPMTTSSADTSRSFPGGNFSASAAQRPINGVPAAPPPGIAPATIDGTPVPSYGGTYNPVSGTTAGGRTGSLTTSP